MRQTGLSPLGAETRLSLATRHAPDGNGVAATLAALKGMVTAPWHIRETDCVAGHIGYEL
jgi:hypothetical protein